MKKAIYMIAFLLQFPYQTAYISYLAPFYHSTLTESQEIDEQIRPDIPIPHLKPTEENSTTMLSTTDCMMFDGNDDYIDVTSDDAFNVYPLTIEAWIKTTDDCGGNAWHNNSDGGAIAIKYGASSGNGFSFHVADGSLAAWYYREGDDVPGFQATTRIDDGIWHHVALVIDASGGTIYIDGADKKSKAWSGTGIPGAITSTAGLTIGTDTNFNGYLDGQLDEVRIWNTGRTSDQINNNKDTELLGTETGLLLYYNFNDASRRGLDCTNNSNFGCLMGNPAAGAGAGPDITNVSCTGGGGIPEINLLGGSTPMTIDDGANSPNTDDDTDFGTITIGSPEIHTFTIDNEDAGPLAINSITSTGTNSSEFVVGSVPSSVTGNGSDDFTVTFTPTATGTRTATININNNDCDESSYNFAVEGGGTVLPVKIIALHGIPSNGSILLEWATASEFNNTGFHIEHSLDAKQWQPISFVESKGNALKSQAYTYIDSRPLPKLNYYRLKQMDFDGTFEYSKVISVKMDREGKGISLFPNPTTGSVTLALETNYIGEASITLYDLTGKQMKMQTLSLEGRSSRTEIALDGLPVGVYLAKVQLGWEHSIERLFVE